MTTKNAAQASYTGTEFEHDIFVSYSHGIPPESGGDSDLKTWTHDLVEKLKEHIGYSLENERQPINVWYDAMLPGNVPLTDTLKRKVEKSSTLLIVITRHYLSSEWCQKEREWFKNEIKRRGGGIENVFVVRAMATENKDWPDFLKDGFGETVLGYPFCNEAKGRDARPFGWVKPSQSDQQFYDALTKLASDIATKLDEIRKEQPPTPPNPEDSGAQAPSKTTDGPIFVAPGTEDVHLVVKEIRMHLEGKGCKLLLPKMVEIEEFTEQDEDQTLHIARAFVQCIGFLAATKAGAEIGRVQWLNQRAREQSIPQFLWRNSSIPLNAFYNPTYKQFVESLGDIPERTASELADEVIEHLRKRQTERNTEQPLVAFIEVPAAALSAFDQLKNGISIDDCVLLPLKPPIRGKISQIQKERQARQQVYRTCSFVLLMYCIAGQLDWLRDAILNYLQDIAPVRREHHRLPVPVVIDSKGEAEGLATILGVDVIPWREGSDPNTLWRQLRDILTR